MENCGPRKNKFSLKNRSVAARVPLLAECNNINVDQDIVGNTTKNNEKEDVVNKQPQCNQPLLLTLSSKTLKWQPIPSLANILKSNENRSVKENKDTLKLETSAKSKASNSWVPLPKPCMKYIAHQYLKVKPIICEDDNFKKYKQNYEKLKTEALEKVKNLKLGNSKKRASSPQNNVSKKFKVDHKPQDASEISGCPERELLQKCPLCLLEFSTSSQVEIDAHMALCFSEMEDDGSW